MKNVVWRRRYHFQGFAACQIYLHVILFYFYIKWTRFSINPMQCGIECMYTKENLFWNLKVGWNLIFWFLVLIRRSLYVYIAKVHSIDAAFKWIEIIKTQYQWNKSTNVLSMCINCGLIYYIQSFLCYLW